MVNGGSVQGICSHFPLCPLSSRFGGTSHMRVGWPGSGIEGVCFLQLLPLKTISMPNCHTLG